MAEASSSIVRRRGQGAAPRKYTAWEWIKGYAAWIALVPVYLALWGYAAAFGRIPGWLLARLVRSHYATTAERERDVRIPFNPDIPAYMLRWWKIKRNALFNCYYHIVRRSDDDRALHDHPWWSFSIVLEGGYYEHRILNGGIHTKIWYGPGSVLFRRSGSQAHRLELARTEVLLDGPGRIKEGDKWFAEVASRTIFITGPVLRRWGFHDTKQWVDAYDWDDYCAAHGIETSIGMKGYAEQLKAD